MRQYIPTNKLFNKEHGLPENGDYSNRSPRENEMLDQKLSIYDDMKRCGFLNDKLMDGGKTTLYRGVKLRSIDDDQINIQCVALGSEYKFTDKMGVEPY
jgi:hypothetical protein